MSRYRIALDLQQFAQEKTEKATPKKRQDARKKGQVAKSMELPAAFILLFVFLFLFLFGGFMKERLHQMFVVTFHDYLLLDLTPGNLDMIAKNLVFEGFILLAPIFIAAIVIGILGNYVQFGFLVSGDPLKMKLSKLNPLEGAKRIFGMRALVEFAKTMLKMAIIGAIVFTTLNGEKDRLMQLSQLPLESILYYAAQVTVILGLKIAFVLVVLAIFDYMYQKYDFEKNLRMSKQDIKDEYKKSEGDPLIKGKIREKQRKMALQRMMQEVPKADVVITNPTHYAVAIRYDASQMEAPAVIAKGADYIALKIKAVAKEHGIVTMENKPLARSLYDQVEIGQAIPAELFQAVAEVLAYVYKLKGRAN